MTGHWTDLYSFITGAIRRPDLGYLVLSNDEAARANIAMASVVQWKPTGWGDGGTLKWRAAGAAMVRQPLEQLCLVGEFGQVLLVGSGDRHEEHVDGALTPKERGPLRGVRAIGQHVYCVGMDRQAYRRNSATGSWARFDHGLPPAAAGEVAGLEAIDGYSETDMYAVGWDGEIWQHDGQRWTPRDSPVNTVLVDVCCAEDGWVYACGRNGVLIKGRNDRWSVLDLGGFSDDIWSLASFAGQLYLATMESVLTSGPAVSMSLAWGRSRPRLAVTSSSIKACCGRLVPMTSYPSMARLGPGSTDEFTPVGRRCLPGDHRHLRRRSDGLSRARCGRNVEWGHAVV